VSDAGPTLLSSGPQIQQGGRVSMRYTIDGGAGFDLREGSL